MSKQIVSVYLKNLPTVHILNVTKIDVYYNKDSVATIFIKTATSEYIFNLDSVVYFISEYVEGEST